MVLKRLFCVRDILMIIKEVGTSCVKQSDSPKTLHTYWGEPDQRNTDNINNYYLTGLSTL